MIGIKSLGLVASFGCPIFGPPVEVAGNLKPFVVCRDQVRTNSYIPVYLVAVGNLSQVRNGAKEQKADNLLVAAARKAPHQPNLNTLSL